MAKLYFRYGAMGSSKTANALMVRYNYLERGCRVVMLKPAMEVRDGDHTLSSRIGLEAPCQTVEEFLRAFADHRFGGCDAVIVDEAQFLTARQVEELCRIVDEWNIPVICYGLRTDFQSHLFEGSRRLMELADVLEEIPTICWCGKKAHFNARIQNGRIVRTGEQVLIGGNETYTTLCRRHFLSGQLQPTDETSE